MTPAYKPGDRIIRTGETTGPVKQCSTQVVKRNMPGGFFTLESLPGIWADAEWPPRGFRPADEEGKT